MLKFLIELSLFTTILASIYVAYLAVEAGRRIRSMRASYEDPQLRRLFTYHASKQGIFSTKKTPLKLSSDELYSDIYCFGSTRRDRTCRVRNAIFDVQTEKYMVVRNPKYSFFWNSPVNPENDPVLDLTSVDQHNVFYWYYKEMAQLDEAEIPMARVNGSTLLFSRFVPSNLMHAIHDDILGMYASKEIWPQLRTDGSYIASDRHGGTDQDPLYALPFPKYPRGMADESLGGATYQRREIPVEEKPKKRIVFEDVVVGNTKRANWYQYGFGKPQGPIPDYRATGWQLRNTGLEMLRKLNVPDWFAPGEPCIAMFARRKNRKILNEEALADELSKHYKLPICWIRMEDEPLPKLLEKLRRAKYAFGMHGALLIAAMFLPPGATLIEGFPYAVPANNYTPYKTLCNLEGMGLRYHAWTNTHPELNVDHPDWEPSKGGLKHLPAAEQQKIKSSTTVPPHPCCSNPYWLYRIYQDTTVTIPEVIQLFDSDISSEI